jgi:hypothetical protein
VSDPPVFLLSAPRSGSTLLRVMLAGHRRLFSPPELNLLPFADLGERDVALREAAKSLNGCDPREGLIEAVMRLHLETAGRAAARIGRWQSEHATTRAIFDVLRRSATPRILVDKSTLNASSLASLIRSTVVAPGARYVYLRRRPEAVIESLIRTYFSKLPIEQAFAEAEILWRVPNENILAFLRTLPTGAATTISFEELVAKPRQELAALCGFLRIPFEDALMAPYDGDRMTRGLSGHGHSPGDPNFHSHAAIEANLAESWRKVTLPGEMSEDSQLLARRLGYEVSRRAPANRRDGGGVATDEPVILVAPPFSYRPAAYLAAVRRLGLAPVVALDPRFGVPAGVGEFVSVSFAAPERAAAELAADPRTRRARAVVAVDDGAVEVTALAARALGLPHNTSLGARAANDKLLMRSLFRQAGVPSPDFAHHYMCEDPVRIAKRLTFPVVLKPLFLSGSRGVMRANTADEFVAAFERLDRLLQLPGTGPDPKSCLVEEYVPGVEVALDGVLSDGELTPLALYDKPDPLVGPFFEETLLVTPSRLPAQVQQGVRRSAEQALAAAGLREGPVHVEVRLNERGAWVIEFAARTVGGECSRTLSFEGGLTLEELVVCRAMGLDTTRFVRSSGSDGVMMIPVPGAGILRSVAGVEEAKAVALVTGVSISAKPGELLVPLPEGERYVGYIFARGDTPCETEAALRTAFSKLVFEVDGVTRVRLRLRFG